MSDIQQYASYWQTFAGNDGVIEEFEPLAAKSSARLLNKGDELIVQGDPTDSVFLVVRGSFKTVRYSKNGHEIWLSSFTSNSLIGEMSGLTGSSRTSTVVCVKQALVLNVEFNEFEQMIRSSSSFGLTVARMLAERIRSTSTQLEELATLQTSARLHSELIRLGKFDASDDELILIQNPPSVSELAIRIHAARESTSRAISALEKRGFLSKSLDGSMKVIAPRNFE